MDCLRMRALAMQGDELTSPEAKQHMDECPACRALFAEGPELARTLGDAAAAGPGPAEPSFAELERQLASERSGRLRILELGSGTRWALALAALVVPILVGMAKHRHNLAEYPVARLILELGSLAGLALASCWLWLRPLYRRQPGHCALWCVLGLGLALPWALSLLPAALPERLSPSLVGETGELERAMSCFGFGALTALPALLVVAGLGRRRTGLPGFALLPAVAAALAGLVGLELHCPIASPAHLLMGHAPIAWTLPLLLLLVGLRRRSGRPIPPNS